MPYKVVLYSDEHRSVWDDFVARSKNGTFLFHRDFMEYHQDRFEDCSLMVFEDDTLVALLPANKVGDTVYSHQGLSYGGLLVTERIRMLAYKEIFESVLDYLDRHGIQHLYLKKLPYIYHRSLSGELDYVLNMLEAKTVVSDSYFVLDNAVPYVPNRNRNRALKKAAQSGLKISETGIDYFWEAILTENLKTRYGVAPVHSITEIKHLMARFPDHIKFFGVVGDGQVKAGAVVFVTAHVAHVQYSSGDQDRDETAALDFLFHEIIRRYTDKKYISFGSSATDATLKIDTGLAYWKESFGATCLVQEQVQIKVENKRLLQMMFL